MSGTGRTTFELRTKGQVAPDEVMRIYETTVPLAQAYLKRYGVDVEAGGLPPTHLTVMIISMADLNSAENFSHTRPSCMACTDVARDATCADCYLGRYFSAAGCPNANLYIAFVQGGGRYGWRQTLVHELLHHLMFRAGAGDMSEARQHRIIDSFISRYGQEIETGHVRTLARR